MRDKCHWKIVSTGLGIILGLTLINLWLASGGISAHKVQEAQAVIETVTVDGCQYLGHRNGGVMVYAHKGNCTNAVHVDNWLPKLFTNSAPTNATTTP